MATDHNFRIKNGLTVGSVEVIDSSGKLTANAFGTDSNEKIEDVVADMITGSTHSNITVTYNDTNGTLAFAAAAQYGDSDVEDYLDGGTSTPSFASADINGNTTISGTLTFDGTAVYNALNLSNNNIIGVNNIGFADPGPNEGLTWSNIKIYESPNDLSSNSAGNLQVVYGSTRRLTVNNSGIDVNGTITSSGNLTITPSGSKIILDAYNTSVQEGGGIFFREGFSSSNKYNLSIMARSRSNDGSTDGLSINAYEGITFSTGSNSYNERLYLHSTAAFTVPISTTGAISGTSLDTGQGANELYAMNQNVRTTDGPTFANLTLNGNLDVNGNNIIDVNQINATGDTGWLDFNMDTDSVYPQSSTDNQTVLGSITHMNFVGDSNGNGTGGIFYWGYGVNKNDSGTFTQTMALDRSGNLTAIGQGKFASLDVDGIIDNTYNNGNVAAPNNSDHTAGTRIKFYDGSSTSWYAMGIESNTLWFNSDNKYKWYEDSTIRMTLDGANLTVTGSVTASTINTGQGATEVHLMNQNVRTSDSPTFADLTVTGNLNITGDINSYNVTDLDVTDKTITVGVGGSASTNDGAGLVVDGASASILWENTFGQFRINKSLEANGFYTEDQNGTVASRFGIYGWDNELQFTKRNLSTNVHTGTLMSLDYSNNNAKFAGRLYPSGQATNYVDSTRIANWQTAYGWGDHSSAGYLTSSSTQSKYLRSDANDTWSGNIETTSTNGIRFGNSNQTDTNDGYIAAGRFASGLNIVGTQTSSGTGRQVRFWGELIRDNGSKIWHADNDGPSSGLNADLLDDQHGSYYLNYNNFTNTPTIPTNNNQLTNGAGYITDGNTNWNNTYGFITTSAIGTHIGKGPNNNYVASSTSTSNRGNYGEGVWAYSGYSTGSNRPFTYDATLQVMPDSSRGFEISVDWVSQTSTPIKIRSLRDCCQGWSDYSTVWTSTTDGASSGLDADLLDGSEGSYYLNYNNFTNTPTIPTNNNQLTNGAGYITSADGGNAATLDSLDSTQFLRSDADDEYGSTSANRYIRFNTNSGQYIASGGSNSRFPIQVFAPTANGGDAAITFHISNDYAGYFGLASDWNDLAWGGWSVGSSTKYRILHTGNYSSWNRDDRYYTETEVNNLLAGKLGTSAKAADSELLDGLDLHTGRNNEVNKVVRTDSNGYIQAGWINTTSGSTTTAMDRIYASNDGYIRYYTPANFLNSGGFGDKLFNNQGENHSSSTNFNTSMPAGVHYMQQGTNGPTGTTSHQFYGIKFGLGNDYSSSSSYSSQMYYPRAGQGGGNGLYFRDMENGSWGSWRQVDAGTLGTMSPKSGSGNTGSNQIIRSHSNNYIYHGDWIQIGNAGLFSTSSNSAHFKPNTTTSYGTWQTSGSKGGYDGIMFDSGGNMACMWDSVGNGGFYQESGAGWTQYFHVNNSCTAFGSSTTSSSYEIYVHGALYATNNIVAYSDRRIKENIVQIDGALEKVNNLVGVYYNKKDDESKQKEIGFIAQDVNEVVPELVTYAEDVDQYGVKYQNATALLVEAVKELTQQVNDLKQELEELKNA